MFSYACCPPRILLPFRKQVGMDDASGLALVTAARGVGRSLKLDFADNGLGDLSVGVSYSILMPVGCSPRFIFLWI